jgi:nicotinamide riboside transporter PnuC
MKSFVRKIEESERWLAVVAGVLLIALFLAAEATNELAYLLLYALLAIQYARKWWREKRWKGSKALLGGVRNKGSR